MKKDEIIKVLKKVISIIETEIDFGSIEEELADNLDGMLIDLWNMIKELQK